MKKFTTTITTVGGAFEFNDTNIPNSGTTVLNQFNAKQTIHSTFLLQDVTPTEIYIPFHAIQYMESAATIVDNPDMPDTNCGEEGPSIDCTKVSWKGSSDLEVFDPISEGDTIQINLSGAGFYFICSPDDGTTLVEPTYTCDMASATFEYSNDILHFEPTQTGTAHITLDYMGCKINLTVEVA